MLIWASVCTTHNAMENTFATDNLSQDELNEKTRVALNKIRAFVRSLEGVERRDKQVLRGSNDYAQGGSDAVSSDTTGT